MQVSPLRIGDQLKRRTQMESSRRWRCAYSERDDLCGMSSTSTLTPTSSPSPFYPVSSPQLPLPALNLSLILLSTHRHHIPPAHPYLSLRPCASEAIDVNGATHLRPSLRQFTLALSSRNRL
ncbi:hypothetical protein MSAN_00289000 [Mycena sanguinolenta]|uniref:Uncharacterized protein n=1 Tax=Mycena sanguinolenta TaxID=230812 RepID=A0A8H7DK04_9AGAR|nr:hypothetical protein MSAN_00289000 [Mycena sanguinolenta]